MLSKIKKLRENKLIRGAAVLIIGVIVALIILGIIGVLIINMLPMACGCLPAGKPPEVAFEQEQTQNGKSVTITLINSENADAIYVDHPNGDTQHIRIVGGKVTVNNLEDGDRLKVIGVKELVSQKNDRETLADEYEVK